MSGIGPCKAFERQPQRIDLRTRRRPQRLCQPDGIEGNIRLAVEVAFRSGPGIDGEGIVGREEFVAFDRQAQLAAHAAYLRKPHAAALGKAQAEIAQAEGDIALVRIDIREKPGTGAVGRKELDHGFGVERGGAPQLDGEPAHGFFVEPTIFDHVPPTATIATEEVFGPVVTVLRFGDEAGAVALANDTPYGLSASVWTRDLGRAHRIARDIEAGVVSVNSNSSVHIGAPFGGWKQSGNGRELGVESLRAYTELKNVYGDITP